MYFKKNNPVNYRKESLRGGEAGAQQLHMVDCK